MNKRTIPNLLLMPLSVMILHSSSYAVTIKNIEGRDIYVHDIKIKEIKIDRMKEIQMQQTKKNASKKIAKAFAKLNKILKKKKIKLKKNKNSLNEKNTMQAKVKKLRKTVEKYNAKK